MKHRFILLLILLLFTSYLKAQKNKLVALDSNLYIIPINGINVIADFGNDGVFIIDAGYEESAEYLSEIFDSLGNKDISLVVNTHWHFDHVGANKVFGKNSLILSHKNAYEFMKRNEVILGNEIPAHSQDVLPNFLITNKFDLNFNGKEINIIPLIGAHTNGDLIVYFPKQKVLHIGDIIFADMFPFIDIDHGGNVLKSIENIKYLVDSFPDDTKYVPGHGRIYSKHDVRDYLQMIEQTTKKVKLEKNSGKELEEINAKELLEKWKGFEKGFSMQNWVEYIYKSL